MGRLAIVVTLLLAVAGGWFYSENPLLFGQSTGVSPNDFEVIDHDSFLDDELFPLTKYLGKEFGAYRNHCLRVLTFTKYFLDDSVLQELPEAMELAAVALAYHDIALWSDQKLDYLEPSVAQLEVAMARSNYTKTQVDIMKDIITEHHKVTAFTSTHGPAADALINAVRMADWSDATMGVVRFDMPAGLLELAYKQIDEAGFHMILADIGPRLSPGNITGQLEVLNIFRW
eukprot:Nitzschia sp. Nitz4//scaffold174_size87051//45116//45805//NITZ4_005110-RA/size87051-processed-gene-0.89-mRNA-1//-1//CDS//3329538875//4153//frame0